MKRLPMLALVLLAGCARRDATSPPATVRAAATDSMRSQALIDSGNAAIRVKDYDGAARRYASAVAIRPDDPAAYYGLGMALARLGRDDEAREAYARSRELQSRAADTTTHAR